jgi:hypothetical protein
MNTDIPVETRLYYFMSPVIAGPFDFADSDKMRRAAILLRQRIMRGRNGLTRCFIHQTGVAMAIKYIPSYIRVDELDQYITFEIATWAIEAGFFPTARASDEQIIRPGSSTIQTQDFTFSSRISHDHEGEAFEALILHLTKAMATRNRSIIAVSNWDTYGCTVTWAPSVDDEPVAETINFVLAWAAHFFGAFPVEMLRVPKATSALPVPEEIKFYK